MPHFVDDDSIKVPDQLEVDQVAEGVGEYLACGF